MRKFLERYPRRQENGVMHCTALSMQLYHLMKKKMRFRGRLLVHFSNSLQRAIPEVERKGSIQKSYQVDIKAQSSQHDAGARVETDPRSDITMWNLLYGYGKYVQGVTRHKGGRAES